MPNLMLETVTTHRDLLSSIQQQLVEVASVFTEQLKSDQETVNSLCQHIERYRGKMLRPSLVLVSGLAVHGEPFRSSLITQQHVQAAAVLELIHMATLVHDDVLDEASIRRRGATVNSLHGNESAVMLGDYLISNAFHLCSKIGDPAVNLLLGSVTNRICEGELMQLAHRDDLALEESVYTEIISRKTAALVGACCRLGTQLSGASEALCDAMDRFGTAIGVAFQIQDDLLDLAGDPETVGKTLGRDLAKGKATLPVILHLAEATGAQRDEALQVLRERNGEALCARLDGCGAMERAHERAVALVERAKCELQVLPASPARDMLASLADGAVNRRS